MFSHGAAEERSLLQHHADLSTQIFVLPVAHIHAVNGDAAAVDVVVAWQQVDQRALARSCCAEEGDALARIDGKADAMQDIFMPGIDGWIGAIDAAIVGAIGSFPRRPAVGKFNVVELDPALHRFIICDDHLVLDRRFRVQYLPDAPCRRLGPRHHGEDVAEQQQRGHGDHQVAVERHQLADGEPPVDHVNAAPEDDCHHAHVGQHQQDGHGHGHQPANLDMFLHVLVVACLEAFNLKGLACIGLDHACAARFS